MAADEANKLLSFFSDKSKVSRFMLTPDDEEEAGMLYSSGSSFCRFRAPDKSRISCPEVEEELGFFSRIFCISANGFV